MNQAMIDLRLFDAGSNVHTTTGYADTTTGEEIAYSEIEGLSEEMKTYYSDYLIDNAEPKLIHDQFAQKLPIPAGNGKTVQFRKYDPLPKLTETLREGVTPTGQSLNMSTVEATVHQYGGYVELSDLLLLCAVDNNLVMVTKLLGSQAGRTLDTITREVLCGGTNVQYGADAVSARYLLKGGEASDNHYMSVDCIKRAVRFLKNQNAERINGAYACIIHPDCAYDLTNDLNWKYPYQYAASTQLYEGEIGMIEGVRFVESTEAKIFHAPDIAPGKRCVPCLGSGYRRTTDLGAAHAGTSTLYRLTIGTPATGVYALPEMVGRGLLVHDVSEDSWQYCKISGTYYSQLGDNYVYLDRPLLTGCVGEEDIVLSAEDEIYPDDAGFMGRDVYATLVLGENAYGTTELSGGGLEHIVKQLGSAGTADPLNQRATVGWKATKAAVRLMEPFMVRIETASTFEGGAN